MAFVLASTSNTTGLTALTSFFIPAGHDPSTFTSTQVVLLSNTDYYVAGNQYTSNNSLYIDDASPRLQNVLNIYFGPFNSYTEYFPQPVGTYINFSLFSQLSSINGQGNNSIPEFDFRSNSRLRNIIMWGGGSTKDIKIDNLTNLQNIDTRQSQIRELNLSGTTLVSLNASDSQLSAFNLSGYITNAYVGRNPFANNYIDFTNCSTSFLTGVQLLKFSRWNQFSSNPYYLTSVNLKGPLSSLRILDLSQNKLSSVLVPQLTSLERLYLGGNPYVGEAYTFEPFYVLSACNIVLTSLTGLKYLDIGGVGPLSSLNEISGIQALSSLQFLNAYNNYVPFQQQYFRDLDLSIIPGGRINQLNVSNNFYLTAVDFGKHQFDSGFYGNSLLNIFNLNVLQTCHGLPNLTGLKTLEANSLFALQQANLSSLNLLDVANFQSGKINSLILPNAGALRRLDCSYSEITSFDATSPKQYRLEYANFTNTAFLSTVTIDLSEKLNILFLSDSQVVNLNLNGLSALGYLEATGNNSLKELDLDNKSLSSLASLLFVSSDALTSFKTDLPLPSLSTIQIGYLPNIQTTNFSNQPALKDVYIVGNYGENIYLNSNNNLYNVSIVDASYGNPYNSFLLKTLSFSNNLNFRSFIFNNAYSVNPLSSLSFTNCPVISSIDITRANLRNCSFVQNLNTLKFLTLNTCSLTSLNFLENNPLSSISISNNTGNLRDLQTLNNIPTLTLLTLTNNALSSVDRVFDLSLNNLRTLTINQNTLTTINRSPTGIPGITRIDVRNNLLNYYTIDSFLLALCATRTQVYPGLFASLAQFDYRVNSTGRTKFTDTAYMTLTSRGWRINVNSASEFPVNVTRRAVPIFSPIAYPATLGYTNSFTITSNAGYLGTPVATFLSVLSGPGALVSTNVLSALSGTGTVTVAVSTINDTIFYPTSTLLHFTLEKSNISNNIVFSGLNKIYTGNALSATATVNGYPGLIPSLTYYSGTTPTTPVAAGFYTVSAVASDDNVYGTATAVLTVIDTTAVYTLPGSATSSYIYSPKTLDSDKDIVVSFDYAFYGSEAQGTEGFSVVFSDFNTYATRVSGGGPGKALNYTNLSLLSTNGTSFAFVDFPGRNKGVLGIGFDASGNFALTSINVEGYNNKVPNTIALRGRYLDGYNMLYRTESLSSNIFTTPINLYQNTINPEFYSARVRLTNLGKRVIVDLKPLTASKYNNYLDVNLVHPITGIVNVAVGYSSGNNKPTFKLKNFNLNCFIQEVTATPSDLFSLNLDGPGTTGAGGVTFTTPYNYSFFFNPVIPTGLPYAMNLYVNTVFIANVLFDSSLSGQDFAFVNNSPYKVFYSQFLSGSKFLP